MKSDNPMKYPAQEEHKRVGKCKGLKKMKKKEKRYVSYARTGRYMMLHKTKTKTKKERERKKNTRNDLY